VDEVESFRVRRVGDPSCDASTTRRSLKRNPGTPRRRKPPTLPPAPPSSSAILASGRDTTLGNVGEFAWQDKRPLLAVTISTSDKAGNGVSTPQSANRMLRVLDSATSVYSGLAWRKESADLAVLRSKTDDRHDGPTETALAWTRVNDAAGLGTRSIRS